MPVRWSVVWKTVCKGAQREPHRSKHLARNHPWQQLSPICHPKPIYSSLARCAHVKRHTRVQLPMLQPTNARSTLGTGTAFSTNSGVRYEWHVARINTVSATCAATFTPTSAGTRVGSIERPQRSYPRILMDWVANPLRDTQPHRIPLQRKVPTKANSLHRTGYYRGE